jgi:Zinc carboxypeptidase/Domain of unknown function (DUF5011)/GEVED domain/Secretion system C-terminal sorting domain/Fibronectin type III domain
MKKPFLLVFIMLSLTCVFSQNQIIAKRIKIVSPSQLELLKIKEAGIDLSCGAIFENNALILEIGTDELNQLESKGINYSILVDDLISHYKSVNETELPLAKAQLEAKKNQSKITSKSLSTKSTAVDNYIQYEGSSEVNWSVPTNFNLGSMGGCLTYSEMLAELDQMRALYPNIISIKTDASPTNQKTHGNSYTNGGAYATWPGQTIYYVRISDNPDTDEANEPESLYTGMTHSREVSSMMNLMYYMWYLLENYNSDAGIKNLVDNHEMYFIPVANPDGLLWNQQIAPNGGGMQRKNLGPYNTGNNAARGVDLNRNYNYFWGSHAIYANGTVGSSGTASSDVYRGPSAFSEPETQIVRDFSATKQFKTAMNHHASSNLIPHAYNGYPGAPASGREAEYHKFSHDMTRFNRYVYGEAPDILTIANGDMSDWMLGGATDLNGSNGSGKAILALAPENGSWITADGEGGFWPNATKIVEIAQRAMRMNFANAYHSGKFAHLHDLTPTNINTTSGNLKFGLEYIGQTLGNITVDVTPISSNIISITPPVTQTGWAKLEQRTLNAPYTLSPAIQANDEIEFQVSVTNDNGYLMYRANITKRYNPTVLAQNNPDATGISEWTSSGSSAWGTVTTAGPFGSSTVAITDSPVGAYTNNQSKIITYNSPVNLSGSAKVVVQFYAKWDLERNFDYVQFQGSTNGTTWVTLSGKYTKPGANISTNRYGSTYSSNTSTGKSDADRNNQATAGLIYDADTMDKWVMEEILIDATENSALFGASNARFRFVLDSDNSNRADGYPTTFDGFYFDDFSVTSIQIPCVANVPTGITSSNITAAGATITWNNIPSATYDIRFKAASSSTWTNVTNLTTSTYSITGLTASTNFEVQVRSNCGTSNSEFSASYNFSTIAVTYCASNSTNSTRGYIGNLTFGTVNNTSGYGTGGYSNFTSTSTNVTTGTTYPISVGKIVLSGRTTAIRVWIDYNRDGDFNDAGEQIIDSAASLTTPITSNITIPTTALPGSTRMRVSLRNGGTPASCGTFTYGEVEDYKIVIQELVDTTPPVISLVGTSSINLNVGDVYSELGATANDNKDGNITANIVIGGTVNTNTAGTYIITYNVSDAAGNPASQVTRTVNVIADTTPPVISLVGTSSINLFVGDFYSEPGATATDNKDGNITANIVIAGTVNTNTAGTYIITYNVSDAAGNPASQVTRTVNVIADTTPPVISLVGTSSINLNVGDVYSEQGATAADNKDGNITANIVIAGDNVDSNTAGTYTITYNVSDAAGNPATQVTRTVNVIPDTTPPVISLVGTSSINLNVGDTYSEQGATATDNKDGNITANIVIAGTVNTNTAGTYIVTYNVSDAAGNPANQVTRTVNVIADTTPPVISLVGNSSININVGGVYSEQGATAFDNKDGNITANIVIAGTVNTNIAGTYIVTYNVSDAAGNLANQVTRTVNVIALPTNTVLHQGYFETGWDGWTSGGIDCARYSGSRSAEGSFSIYIRDNTGTTSAMTSPAFNFTSYNQVQVTFSFYAVSMESGEDFWLRYFNGSTWVTVAQYARGTNFNNNTFYTTTVTLNATQYNFASNSQFRFQNDASADDDLIYIDRVIITGIRNNTAKESISSKTLDIQENIISKNEFLLYPNPVKEGILNITPKAFDVSYRIINAIGQVVNKGKTTQEIDVTDLEAGTYFLEVNDGKEIVTKRFIKE